MISCAFVIPGDIDLPTGGYAYDRRVLAGLAACGIDVHHVALPGSYPAPTVDDLRLAETTLAEISVDTTLLIDGLAFGAMPADFVRRVRQPIVALCHHPLALEAGLSEAHQRALHASETAALAYARHVIVTSATTARTLIADFGVVPDKVTVAEPGTERAARATGTGAPLQLLAVGSIVPRKGYDVLVEALMGLAHRDWHLTIAGSDDRNLETTQRLRQQIAESGLDARIRLMGAATEAELNRLYARADIFLMPSLFEGYGMVLTEAMARGLPIVCTTGGAAAETVPDAAAIKVPPGDASAFGTALASLLEDRVRRRRFGDAAWTAAQSLPTWNDTARIIADVIRKGAA